MEIGQSTHLRDVTIVSHDLAIVPRSRDRELLSRDVAIVAYPPSDRRRHIEVSPRVSFSIGFHRSRLIAIISLF